MDWKKRGQKGWKGSKTAKELTKGRERQYGESEVNQQLQEDFEGDKYRYTGSKRFKNYKASYQSRIDRYERRLCQEILKEETMKIKGEKYYDNIWFGKTYYKNLIKRLKEEMEELK